MPKSIKGKKKSIICLAVTGEQLSGSLIRGVADTSTESQGIRVQNLAGSSTDAKLGQSKILTSVCGWNCIES